MLNFIVLSQIMLRFDKFINLRLQVATVNWQVVLPIIIFSLLWGGCLFRGEYGELNFRVFSPIMLKLYKFVTLRAQMATIKWQLQLGFYFIAGIC